MIVLLLPLLMPLVAGLTSDDVDTIDGEMQTWFRANNNHLPTAVRLGRRRSLVSVTFSLNLFPHLSEPLAFHDCPTVCDGCINITDSHNDGLKDVIDAFEELWTDYVIDYPDLSRADFWAISAMAAINRGVTLNNRKCTE